MSVTRLPVGGRGIRGPARADGSFEFPGDGEHTAPASLSDLEVVYGPHGLTGQVQKYVRYVDDGSGGVESECAFTAADPREQAALDAWVVLFDGDSPETIRGKIAADPDMFASEIDPLNSL